jgi:hypothetical protein
MTIDEQVQWLKDNGYWRDFLIEFAHYKDIKITDNWNGSNLVDLFLWSGCITNTSWGLVGSELRCDEVVTDIIILPYIEQWEKEYPELFI